MVMKHCKSIAETEMLFLLFLVSIYATQINAEIPPEAYLNVSERISFNDYTVETHHVTTDDGYILTLFHIPGNKTCQQLKAPVFIMHGFITSAADWIFGGPTRAISYLLADECYDVWLGNQRGNRYSQAHVSLNPQTDSKAFYDYSIHETGFYDVPAMVDYVLLSTGEESLFYIGHSQGTSDFFIMTSEKPEYNSKIKLAIALAPIVYMKHVKSLIVQILSKFHAVLKIAGEALNINEILGYNRLLADIKVELSQKGALTQDLFLLVTFLAVGFDYPQVDRTGLPVYFSDYPSSDSFKSAIHFLQLIDSGKFRQYDYGLLGNFKEYGRSDPPEYNLTKITAPVHIFYGKNDWLDAEEDVEKIITQLSNVTSTLIPYEKFNHFDFNWSLDIVNLLNTDILNAIKNYS